MRVLPTVTLTTNEKRVLAKIIASPTPKVAGEEISGDQNLAAARDQLANLGAIEFVGGEASLTAQGEQLAKDDNITGEDGQLTPDGEQLAHTNPKGKQEKDIVGARKTVGDQALGGGMNGNVAPPAVGAPVGGNDLFMSYAPTFKEFLENEEKYMKPIDMQKMNRKPSTPQQRKERRAKRWRKTGVSARTVQWMRDNDML